MMTPDPSGPSSQDTMTPDLSGPSSQDTMSPDLPGPSRQDMMNPDLSGPSRQDMMNPDLSGPSRQDMMSPDLSGPSSQNTMNPTSEEHRSSGSPPGAKRRKEMEALTCDMCCTQPRHPRILPCSHTFCAWCIHGLAHTGRAFPCPACLRQTFLPPGGVASLLSIFHSETPTPQTNPDHQEKGNIDSQEKAEIFCVECGQVNCVNCQSTNLQHHRTQHITSAVSHEQAELQPDQQYLQRAVPDARQTMSLQQERQYLPQETQMQAGTLSVDRSLYKPVLWSVVSTDVWVRIEGPVPEMRFARCFQISLDPNLRVFSFCHLDVDPPELWVSYEQRAMKDPPVEAYTETGKFMYKCISVGKVSYKRLAKGLVMCPVPRPGRFRTFCKSPAAANFKLDNRLSGQADICKDTVTSMHPFKTKTTVEFTIKVGPHRAFDVDDTEQYFAVVEEAKESTASRSVLLYKRPEEKAVNTYIPPREPFQPSDVCFYTLRGQEVLLIADERNAIHVVEIDRERKVLDFLRPIRYTTLVQPTAITVDIQDRLWVACRGGSIIMLEQIK
ncbi:hypothetical protein ACOMHN_002852 [Nucella lapillus]